MNHCPYCSNEYTKIYHSGHCQRVKAIEYHPNGNVKRVEFFDTRPEPVFIPSVWIGEPQPPYTIATGSVIKIGTGTATSKGITAQSYNAESLIQTLKLDEWLDEDVWDSYGWEQLSDEALVSFEESLDEPCT